MGVYGWPSGVLPLVGPQGTAGWAMGLPEQARGTTAATQHPHHFVNPATYPMPNLGGVSYVTGVSGPSVSPSDVITVAAGSSSPPSVGGPVGVGGWPVHITSVVGPQGTAGGVMGLPEQARGTAQPTVTGIAEPTVVS